MWNKSIFCRTQQTHYLILIYLQRSQLVLEVALVVPKFHPWKALENRDVHPKEWRKELGELEVVNL